MADPHTPTGQTNIELTHCAPTTEDATIHTWVLEADPSHIHTTDDGWVLPSRYELVGPIASGGMGNILRVRDQVLGREVAMKVLRRSLVKNDRFRDLFLREAQVTARLNHPGIVSVHDLGHFDGGGLWFTMKEVRGSTLGDVIRRLHRASQNGQWGRTADGWTFRRTIDAIARMCDAVGYAHSRGVLHCDLKPNNMMVGDFGEVLVMDWGLAHVAGVPDLHPPNPPHTDKSVVGTPAYMSPEQAGVGGATLGPQSDVWGLGVTLYLLLTGRTPFRGNADDILHALRTRRPPAVHDARDSRIPAAPTALAEVVQTAMAQEPLERFPNATAMAEALRAWLEGTASREKARGILARAFGLIERARAAREEAHITRNTAALRQDALTHRSTIDEKRALWQLEDQATAIEREAVRLDIEIEKAGRTALELDPELPEAHQLLASLYRIQLETAELQSREEDALRLEALLRDHDRGEHGAFLRGIGHIRLWTEPVAEVVAHPVHIVDRRSQAAAGTPLGKTPLHGHEMQRGSWVLMLHADERPPVMYPVRVGRDEHWDGIPAGATTPTPIYIPTQAEWGADDCYVPAGWFAAGGDPQAVDGLPARMVWRDAFFIQRYPVTNAEYLQFLNDLHARGVPELERWIPGHRGPTIPSAPSPYVRRADGTFALGREQSGIQWQADWPVVLVDWYCAQQYATWKAQQSGLPWRLPDEMEWEKAARGVDARVFPWGNHMDASWCHVLENHDGGDGLRSIYATPFDESPYGVRNLAGGVHDWCNNVWFRHGDTHSAPAHLPPEGRERRVLRGGAWLNRATQVRAAARFVAEASLQSRTVGFRLCRSIGDCKPTNETNTDES